jgi:hypothetical protein
MAAWIVSSNISGCAESSQAGARRMADFHLLVMTAVVIASDHSEVFSMTILDMGAYLGVRSCQQSRPWQHSPRKHLSGGKYEARILDCCSGSDGRYIMFAVI